MTPMDAARAALKEVFGYDDFRPGQEDAVAAILRGRDVMAVMPTGAGKSICYQIPALVLEGVTLVVSPLISLMRDQVFALLQNGVRAAYLNSSLTPRQYALALENARRGTYKIIYVAPERLQAVRADIVRLLELQNPYDILTGFDRPNLFFEVRRAKDRDAELRRFLAEHRGQSGVVYCGTRKGVEEVTAMLNDCGVDAVGYHAGMADELRAKAQEDFVADRAPVIVATNAFGMGIDKSNVSFVVHYNMPKDLESYYQEAGRAGRDGEDAVCCLLYQPGDVRLNTFLIDHAQDMSQMDEQTRQVVTARAKERLRQMTFYATGGGCLRAKILQYFGEKVERPFCGNCSGCMAREEERDVSRQAGQIVAAVIAMNGRYGKATVARVLCGQADARLRERGLDKLSAFGSMKAEGEANVRAMIDELIAGDVLTVTEGDYPLLREGAYARDVLRGDMPIRMALLPTDAAPEIKRRVKQKEFVNKALYSRLSDLRKQIAMDQNVPPFIIFTNATLKDMAAKAPRTRAQMLRVAGVGEGKMQRYGDAFLREIAAYEEDEA